MADLKGSTRKPRKQLYMDEAGVRGLRIPASSRGMLSPSKNSFLPQLQENEQRGPNQTKQKLLLRAGSGSGQRDGGRAQRSQREEVQEQVDSAQQVMPVLENMEQDFAEHGGELDMNQFTSAMVQHLEPSDGADGGIEAAPTVTQAGRAAAAIDLFRRVDVHSEGVISWEGMSSYLIEYGMAGGNDTVNTIKTYEASSVLDTSRHENAIDKLIYLKEVDSVVCLERSTPSFRLYDPKRCTVRGEARGHRGSVVNCCYVGVNEQIGTSSVDLTICLWDASSLRLRSRMSTKDVQLCLQYDSASKSLFSGSIGGTLSRWDLQNMCLTETRTGYHKKEINDLLMIHDIGLLATASSDGYVLMWDTETLRTKKAFKGHKKGILSLAYSTDYQCLLTAGVDQEALVWNPYVENEPIFRLKGHTRALCGVTVIPGTPQIISADVSGQFRLWDMRNFRCVQSFGESGKEFNTFCALPPHKRVLGGGSRILMYDYMDEGGDEPVTDSSNVVDALFNPNAGTFYTMSKTNVKFWNAGSGQLIKVLRDAAPEEITAACLSDNSQKLYIGDASGRVCAHALHNGKVLSVFDPHEVDITRLAIWEGTNWLFSASCDGVLKFQTDERSRQPICHTIIKKHRAGITCLACSPELYLLASGGNDMQVVLYDIRTRKSEKELTRFTHIIQAIDFVPSRCLLAVADQGGIVSLWRTRPHADLWAYVYHFKGTPDLGQQLPAAVTALSFASPTESPSNGDGKAPPLLYTADAKGRLSCWNLAVLCEHRDINEDDLKDLFEQHRIRCLKMASSPMPPVREPTSKITRKTAATPKPLQEEIEGDMEEDTADVEEVDQPRQPERGNSSFLTGFDFPDATPKQAKPVAEVELLGESAGHSEAVISMYSTSNPQALITCGQDRRVNTWSGVLEPRGTLLQTHDPNFRFPYDTFAARMKRLDEASVLLRNLGPVERRSSKLPQILRTSASDPALLGGVSGKKRPSRKNSAALL